MARIELNIVADSADDLKATLSALTTTDLELLVRAVDTGEEQPEAGATQDAEPGERQARFKRTKSEIERGLSVEQAKAERAGTAAAQPPASGASESTTSEPTSGDQTSSTDADPFSESASRPTSLASPGSLTTSDVRKAMGDFLNRDGNDAAKIKDILHQFKTDTGAIVEAASGLQSGDYAAFIERLAA